MHSVNVQLQVALARKGLGAATTHHAPLPSPWLGAGVASLRQVLVFDVKVQAL